MGLIRLIVTLAIIALATSSAFKGHSRPRCSSIISKISKLATLKEEEIIPEIVDTVPHHVLGVEYQHKIVDFGNTIYRSDALMQPKIKFDGLDNNTYYLLAMTDPDAPSRATPTYREFMHWLVGNIPGSDFDLGKGTLMAAYGAPGPPKGTGKHRYIFFLYAQPRVIDWTSEIVPINATNPYAGRPNWSVRNFAKKHNLGEPLAANFFQSEFQEQS